MDSRCSSGSGLLSYLGDTRGEAGAPGGPGPVQRPGEALGGCVPSGVGVAGLPTAVCPPKSHCGPLGA